MKDKRHTIKRDGFSQIDLTQRPTARKSDNQLSKAIEAHSPLKIETVEENAKPSCHTYHTSISIEQSNQEIVEDDKYLLQRESPHKPKIISLNSQPPKSLRSRKFGLNKDYISLEKLNSKRKNDPFYYSHKSKKISYAKYVPKSSNPTKFEGKRRYRI